MTSQNYFILILGCLLHIGVFANPVPDSLESELNRLKGAFNKVIFTDSELAKPYADTYSFVANKHQLKKQKVYALMQYTTYYKSQNNIDSALFLGFESLEQSQNLPEKPYLMTIYNSIGLIYEDAGKLDSALNYYKLSLDQALEVNNEVGEVRAYINIGFTQELKREYKESISYLNKALVRSKEYGYTAYYPVVYFNLGRVYESINDDENALIQYQTSLRVSEKNKYKHRYRNAAIAIAKLFLKQSQNDSAKYYVQLAHRYDESISKVDRNEFLLAESELKLRNGSVDEAVRDLQETLLFFENQKDTMNQFSSLVKLAEAYHIKGNNKQSLRYANQAEFIGQRAVDNVYMDDLSLVFYKAYKALNNPAKALMYLERYNTIKSDKRSSDELKLVVREELDRDFQEKIIADSIQDAAQLELIQLQHQQEVENEQRVKQKLFYVLIIIALFAIVFFWAFRNKQMAERQLAVKNEIIQQALQDKEVLMNEIHHRVKNNMQMVSSLLHLKAHATKDKEAEEALIDSQKRIESMQLAHQKMYQNSDFENIEVIDYAQGILNSLTGIIATESDSFTVSGKVLKLPIEKAQAIGFILHELITNSLKYAWDTPENRVISISFTYTDNGKISLNYLDNGKGFDQTATTSSSLGGKLIDSFVKRKLMGEMIENHINGVNYSVNFDLNA